MSVTVWFGKPARARTSRTTRSQPAELVGRADRSIQMLIRESQMALGCSDVVFEQLCRHRQRLRDATLQLVAQVVRARQQADAPMTERLDPVIHRVS